MDIAEIEQLLEIVRDAKISELTISSGSPQRTIKLRKPLLPPAPAPAPSVPHVHRETMGTHQEHASAASAPEIFITAPMVGIFHSIDSLTTLNALVKTGQAVGAIESMKLMNDVVAQHDGVIAEILVEDGMPVEFGQHLFRLEPMS